MSFRRSITVLSVLALFAGLACAQVGTIGGATSAPFTCTTGSGAVTPQVRAEGFTELLGDIVLNCVGGQTIAVGQPVPQANIVVSLNTAVTSRLLPSGTSALNPVLGALSEALLMIDEPGAVTLTGAVPGYGPNEPQTICPTPLSGCAATVGSVTVGTNTYAVANSGTNPAPNVYQGIVQGNQVTFFGVPILPPATSGVARFYRITNIRGNATALSPGSSSGVSQVLASISTNGSTSIPIANPTLIVGFVQNSLTTSNSKLTSFQQCLSQTTAIIANTLQFRELFGTAFKTRVTPLTSAAGAAFSTNSGTPGQNVPGALTNSESGFILPSLTGNNSATAGLASFGTRLKAVFTNVPAGVTVSVSIFSNGAVPANAGNQSLAAQAQLVTSESAPEGSFVTGAAGDTLAVPISGGTGVAVWEVTNANGNFIDTLNFGVSISFTASPATNSPAPGAAQVALSYAPTPTQGAFSAAAGAAASSTLPIPRFTDTSTAASFTTFSICQTVLLWPFTTAQGGFDTGLAIANTTMDPFGTGNQAGTCTLNLYGGFSTGATSVSTFAVPSVAAGTIWTNNLQTIANGFQGYIIGVCNFQYAHGYGAITDTGVRNFISSYLALVMDNGSTLNGLSNPLRGTTAEVFKH